MFYRNKPSVLFDCPKFTMLSLSVDFRLGTPILIYAMFLYLACVRLVFFAVVTGPCDLEAAYVYMAAICLIYWQLLPYYLARVQLAFFAVVTGLCALEAAYTDMAVFV